MVERLQKKEVREKIKKDFIDRENDIKDAGWNGILIAYRCRIVRGEPGESAEGTKPTFFPHDHIPSALAGGGHDQAIQAWQEGRTGALPRFVVVALVLIRRGDRILLVRQSYGRQYWSLPGGVMEQGESVEEAAIREVKEEAGLDVRLRRLVGLYTNPEENALVVTFEGEIIGGTLRPGAEEILDCAFFPFDGLPKPIRDHLPQRIADLDQT